MIAPTATVKSVPTIVTRVVPAVFGAAATQAESAARSVVKRKEMMPVRLRATTIAVMASRAAKGIAATAVTAAIVPAIAAMEEIIVLMSATSLAVGPLHAPEQLTAARAAANRTAIADASASIASAIRTGASQTRKKEPLRDSAVTIKLIELANDNCAAKMSALIIGILHIEELPSSQNNKSHSKSGRITRKETDD
jgi:hypothetical protein